MGRKSRTMEFMKGNRLRTIRFHTGMTFRTILIIAAAVCAITVHAQTQAPPATAKIASIEVSGSKKFTNAQVAEASGLKVGDVVGKEELQTAANRLAASGNFGEVSYRFTTDAAGIHLIFEVEESSGVPVIFDNFPWFTDEELAAALQQKLGSFDGTAPRQGAHLDAIAEALVNILPTHGIHGRVSHTLVEWPDGGQVMQFSVEGNPELVQAVDFSDPLAAKSLQVTAQLSEVVGHPYSRLTMALYAYEEVRAAYLGAGYLKVSFPAPTATLVASTRGGHADSVRVTQPIKLGPLYHFGGVTWTGNSAYSTISLNTMVPFSAGVVVDGNKIQGTWSAIARSYGHIGYMEALLDPTATLDDAAEKVSYHVEVKEGSQYKMGQLILSGLSLDGEKKLRAAWTLTAGSVFDQTYFDDFLSKIAKPTPAIYGNIPVHYEKIGQLLRRDEDRHTVDVLIDFQ
jgi:outer membrane protein assembly factor BamA